MQKAIVIGLKNRGLLQRVSVGDMIARIIARINPKEFSQCFIARMQSLNKLTEGQLVAIDGKVLRGSCNRDDRNSMLYMVSAYSVANKVIIGQMKTDDKSNEITAIHQLIKLLDINSIRHYRGWCK